MAGSQQEQNREERNARAGGQADDELREQLIAEDQFALAVEREAQEEQRDYGDAQRIGRKRVEEQSSEGGDHRHRGQAGAQAGINHEGGQHVNLRAQEMAESAERRLPKNRQECGNEDQDGA